MSQPARRKFKKQLWRGMDTQKLLEMTPTQLRNKMVARHRRALKNGRQPSHQRFLKRCRRALKEFKNEPGTKPKPVLTHLRNMIIVPEMIGNIVGVHNGKQFLAVEVKAPMVGTFLGEYAMTYKYVVHSGADNKKKSTAFAMIS